MLNDIFKQLSDVTPPHIFVAVLVGIVVGYIVIGKLVIGSPYCNNSTSKYIGFLLGTTTAVLGSLFFMSTMLLDALSSGFWTNDLDDAILWLIYSVGISFGVILRIKGSLKKTSKIIFTKANTEVNNKTK